VSVPLARWSRSWWSDPGREHIAATLQHRAKLLCATAEGSAERPKLITLTYRHATASWATSDAVRAFLGRLRHWAAEAGYRVSYLWTAELQARGALHYHLVVSGCPFLTRALLRAWWPHGWHDVRAVPTSQALAYALKYARKAVGASGDGPDVRHVLHSAAHLRHHGCSRDISARPELIPAWVLDVAYQNGVTVDQLDWAVDREMGYAMTWTPGYEPELWDYEELRWKMTERRPADP
jgi:hypothetical protein